MEAKDDLVKEVSALPSDAETLLDSDTVAGITVRPWTLSKGAALSPVFEEIVKEFKRRKLNFRDFFAKSDTINIDQLYFVVAPFIPEILRITLDGKDIENISQPDSLKLVTIIVRQNIEYLKNLFALIAVLARAVKG
jgi:hypothetical protein